MTITLMLIYDNPNWKTRKIPNLTGHWETDSEPPYLPPSRKSTWKPHHYPILNKINSSHFNNILKFRLSQITHYIERTPPHAKSLLWILMFSSHQRTLKVFAAYLFFYFSSTISDWSVSRYSLPVEYSIKSDLNDIKYNGSLHSRRIKNSLIQYPSEDVWIIKFCRDKILHTGVEYHSYLFAKG